MEFEVRVVAGVESCFVSLPLILIQTLQSTRPGGSIPHFLALELRSRDGNSLWRVAWSGSASSSPSAIEVAQQYAECIGLPDHTIVHVLAIANLPKATQVIIEPDTEDDWEVMELNSDHAEAAILNQVGIVHETMRFPLWLHGRTVVTFVVVSVFPQKAVVKLVPGTEVSVSPKGRKKNLDCFNVQFPCKKRSLVKALLRVQDSDMSMVKRSVVKSVELGVALTAIAFVHPETAKRFSLSLLELVVLIPRISSNKNVANDEKNSLKKKNHSYPKELDNGMQDSRQVIVHLLMSESVAAGHIMLARALRLYLKAGLRSGIYVRSFNVNMKDTYSSLSLSPCQFLMFEENKGLDNNSSLDLNSQTSYKINDMSRKTSTDAYADLSAYEEVVATLSCESSGGEGGEVASQSDYRKGLQSLLQAWFFAQVDSINLCTGVKVNSLILGNQTLLDFEVKGSKFWTTRKLQASSKDSLKGINGVGNLAINILYMLTISGESVHNFKFNGYELVFDEGDEKNDPLGSSEILFRKLNLGDPLILYSAKEMALNKGPDSRISSLSWMDTVMSDITNRLFKLLSPVSQIWYHAYNLPLPGHIVIYGPPGSGKTSLARAVARFVEGSADLLAHIVFVSCSKLAFEKAPAIHEAFTGYITQALDHAPSLIIFDDFDSIISSSSDSEEPQPFASTVVLTEFLSGIMDEYAEKRKTSCGIGPIAFIASVHSLDNIPQALTSSGRFDFHVQLLSLAASERCALLKHEIQKRSLDCSDAVLLDIAAKCDGYDAYDLEILVDRAIHAAVGRFLPHCSLPEECKKPMLVQDDFSHAMHEFLPVSMRDITKSASEGGRSGWDDIGGLIDVCNSIKEVIELPSKFPNIFVQAPLRLRSNVLLYGPPGCGKTHIVGAAATACSLRFISIKGPELLNKYIGASEQAVRDIFSKAAAAAPCLIFFDEFDSIAPQRGHDNTGVTDRVVNQFLTELDGVEALTGVFVFAATSRPDLLDAALLRPGRLDHLLFCDFPSQEERFHILQVLSRKLPLAEDVDLNSIARMSDGFSGADLQALLSDAQLAAIHELLSSANGNEPQKLPVITNALLKSTASKARPSVSETEKKRLYGIYNQFLDSKRSASAQWRDAKGKRATLA